MNLLQAKPPKFYTGSLARFGFPTSPSLQRPAHKVVATQQTTRALHRVWRDALFPVTWKLIGSFRGMQVLHRILNRWVTEKPSIPQATSYDPRRHKAAGNACTVTVLKLCTPGPVVSSLTFASGRSCRGRVCAPRPRFIQGKTAKNTVQMYRRFVLSVRPGQL
ncbi:hypothetical protein PABG_12025 [Paracoccidioides brasiliensis Pb03]|nr:hypothetical protein PABG_12025 [Paracoccidioides brasiliensis Pb03]